MLFECAKLFDVVISKNSYSAVFVFLKRREQFPKKKCDRVVVEIVAVHSVFANEQILNSAFDISDVKIPF